MKFFFAKGRIIVCAIFVIAHGTGCMNYYKINSSKVANMIDDTALNKNSKNYIVHFKDTSYALNSASVSNNTLAGSLTPLSEQQVKYLHPTSRKKNRYYRKDRNNVLNQVHIFAETVDVPQNMQMSMPVSAISAVHYNEKNESATTGSHILGVGITLFAVILIGSLIAASALSGLSGLGG